VDSQWRKFIQKPSSIVILQEIGGGIGVAMNLLDKEICVFNVKEACSLRREAP
jgi:hypothetical protein